MTGLTSFAPGFGPCQTIPTTPGTSYRVSFWLRPDGNGSSFASWNGTALSYPSYLGAYGWTNIQLIVTATTPSSTLQFQFQDYASTYMGFDDVTVSNLVSLNYSPALPPACISPQLANGAFQFSFQTVLGQSYTIQQCPDLTSGNWTPYSSFMGDGNVYLFRVPVLGSQPAAYFRVRQP